MDAVENIFEKSSMASMEARKYGDQLYIRTNHCQHVHKNILLQYSKSIAYASRDSNDEELARGYNNRSALLMHLNKIDECLIDIDRALNITKSTVLKSKLEARKRRCVTLDTNKAPNDSTVSENERNERVGLSPRETGGKLNLPDDARSPGIPSASKAIALKYNENFGRHVVATRDIKPGELIVVERAYVCFPFFDKRYLICSHCLNFAWNGIPCDRCAFVVYCSETCKTDAWDEYHEVECTLLPFVPSSLFDVEELFLPYSILALRLLIKAIKSEGVQAVMDEFDNAKSANGKGVDGLTVEGQLRSDAFRSCVNLFSHKDLNKDERSTDGDSIVSHLIESLCRRTNCLDFREHRYDDCSTTIFKLKTILNHLTNVVDNNMFEYQAFFCDCDTVNECRATCDASRGAVIAPFSSFINHSCNANVSRIFLPRGQIAMFTVAPVTAGEQLFASYGTLHTENREYRQQFLRDYFNFTCKCQACEENWPETVDLQKDDKEMIMKKIKRDFEKRFPSVTKSSAMNTSEDGWKFDKETMKHAVKLSQLIYKHFDNTMLASHYNIHYKDYISVAYHRFYGEQFAIPEDCYT